MLDVATFGATYDEIDGAARQGADAWLDAQFSMPPSRHLPIVQAHIVNYGFDIAADPAPGLYRRWALWERALTAPDQLRQLTAYALTQIFVVSDQVDQIFIDPRALSSYYDMLLEHAFGTLDCNVVGWRTDNYNYASQRAIERLGAKKDGVIRGHAPRKDGTIRDTVMYSLRRGEWPEVRVHLNYLLSRYTQ